MRHIELSPEQLLDLYWNKWELPINPYKIAVEALIEVRHLPERYSGLSGRFIPEKRRDNGETMPARIEYNPRDCVNEQRFTIAHELGHYFLGHRRSNRERLPLSDSRISLNVTNLNPKEAQANNYALRLLVPKNYVNYLYWNRGLTSYKQLAKCFGVSDVAMKFRLMMLDILKS